MLTLDRPTTLVGLSELRTRSGEILKAAKIRRVILGKRGKPVAVLVPMEEWERQERLLDEFEDMALGLVASDRVRKASPKDYIPMETVLKRFGVKH
jgi:prevent-host-death family protein